MSDEERRDAEYDGSLPDTYVDSSSFSAAASDDDSEITEEEQGTNPTEKLGTNDKRYPTMTKLLAMQRELGDTVLERGTEAKDKASCARAWKELELLRRIILGKPITVEPAQAKVKRNASPIMVSMAPADQSQAA